MASNNEKSKDLRERLAARGVKYAATDYKPDYDGYQDKFTKWWDEDGVEWVYHERLHEGGTVYVKLYHHGSLGPERVVEATLGPGMGTGATDRAESFADVVNVLRKAARGDFDGSTGMVSENFMILMGRGLGDSWCAAFQEYADRLQAVHERELENALDAHALQAAIENDDGKRYPMQKVLEILKRDMTEAGE